MPEPENWMVNASYLYTLFLDRPAIAWEHLRRHPRYRADWQRFANRHTQPCQTRALKWGLRFP